MILDNPVGQWCMVYSVSPPKGATMDQYHIDKHDIKTMKQRIVAITGRCVVVCEADEFWGGKDSRDYRSREMIDPTWGRLFQCAKAQQKKTLDMHHSFFEGAYVREVVNGVKIVKLSLGS